MNPCYVPKPLPKYRAINTFDYMGTATLTISGGTHTIEDANICKNCSVEVIEFIKKIGEKMNNDK